MCGTYDRRRPAEKTTPAQLVRILYTKSNENPDTTHVILVGYVYYHTTLTTNTLKSRHAAQCSHNLARGQNK